MATRIHELDLDAPLPAAVPLDGRDRLWLVAWRDGRPVGAVLLEPEPGRRVVAGERIAREIGRFETPAGRSTGGRPRRRVSPDGGLPAVSVVICTRDRPDRLPIALDALRRQTHAGFELVVVDNAPSDTRTRRVVRSRWPTATYVLDPIPGPPHARNVGARAASGDVVAYIDDDCRPVPGWVEAVAHAFEADGALGCLTGPILPLELETPAQEALERRGGFNRGFTPRRVSLRTLAEPRLAVQAWRYGAGGNLAVARACLEAVGGFDEALRWSEDLDVLYRVLRAGYALGFEPAAAVHHRHPPRWRQFRRRMFGWGWGYLTFLDKVARTDSPAFAACARHERRSWLNYQLAERAWPALRGAAELPIPIVLAEIAGGLAGYRAYPLVCRRAARRGAPHSPAPLAAVRTAA